MAESVRGEAPHNRAVQWYLPSVSAVPVAPRGITARAHHWLMSNLSETRKCRLLSMGLLSIPSSPGLYIYPGLPCPKCRIQHSLLFCFVQLVIAQPVIVHPKNEQEDFWHEHNFSDKEQFFWKFTKIGSGHFAVHVFVVPSAWTNWWLGTLNLPPTGKD